jgi:hypothetical protein
MTALVRLGKLVGSVQHILVEVPQRLVFGVGPGVEVDGMGHIPRQEQFTHEVSATHYIIPSGGI